MEQTYGTRTYDRYVDSSGSPAPVAKYHSIQAPGLKSEGVDRTYVRVYQDGHVERPVHETDDWRVPYLGKLKPTHYAPMTEAELENNAKRAERERKVMIRGGRPSPRKSKKGGKKMISDEMKALIAERKAKQASGGWAKPAPASASRYFGSSFKASTPKPTLTVVFKKKALPHTDLGETISGEAERLQTKLKLKKKGDMK